MFASRALTSAIVVGSVAVASVFAAAPASAAVLPSGQLITVVDFYDWQFSEANPETAALTPVGSNSPVDFTGVTATDVNDDGLGYALSTDYELEEDPCDPEDPECFEFPELFAIGAALHTADANTGVLGAAVPIQIVTGPSDEPVLADADECLALDYSGGVLLAACNIYSGEGDSAWIGTVDPATAILTPSVLLFDEAFVRFQAIAVDPITGTVWGFDEEEGASWVIDLDGGNVTLWEYLDELLVYAADFDRDGQLWVSAYYPQGPPAAEIVEGGEGLATLDPDTGLYPFNAAWSDPEAVVDALTVWGKPALAATGAVQNPAIAVGAAALLLFGAILAAGTMAVRRRDV